MRGHWLRYISHMGRGKRHSNGLHSFRFEGMDLLVDNMAKALYATPEPKPANERSVEKLELVRA